jgi:hypothetical protein
MNIMVTPDFRVRRTLVTQELPCNFHAIGDDVKYVAEIRTIGMLTIRICHDCWQALEATMRPLVNTLPDESYFSINVKDMQQIGTAGDGLLRMRGNSPALCYCSYMSEAHDVSECGIKDPLSAFDSNA